MTDEEAKQMSRGVGRQREREREEGGQEGQIGYVLSACIAIYSSYCITGLALLPPQLLVHDARPPHRPYPISIDTVAAFCSAHTFLEHVTAIPLTFCLPIRCHARFNELTISWRDWNTAYETMVFFLEGEERVVIDILTILWIQFAYSRDSEYQQYRTVDGKLLNKNVSFFKRVFWFNKMNCKIKI